MLSSIYVNIALKLGFVKLRSDCCKYFVIKTILHFLSQLMDYFFHFLARKTDFYSRPETAEKVCFLVLFSKLLNY